MVSSDLVKGLVLPVFIKWIEGEQALEKNQLSKVHIELYSVPQFYIFVVWTLYYNLVVVILMYSIGFV